MGIKQATLLIVLLLVPLQPPASPEGGSPPADGYLCIEARPSRLTALGLWADESYSSFATAWASPADRRLLEREHIRFFELGGLDDVVLPGAAFTLSGRELRSKGLDDISAPCGLPGYYIVKFKGPEKASWLEEVRATGAETAGGPLSHYNMIVHAGPAQLRAVAALPFVRWVGNLLPAHKLPYPLPEGEFGFDMVFFKEAPGDFASALELLAAGGGRIRELECASGWWNSAVVYAGRACAERILGLPGLWALETTAPVSPRNDVARWVVQSYDGTNRSTPYWDAGLIGNGEIVGIADSGIDYDHIAFRDKMNDAGVPGPDHRKIIRYNSSVDDWDNLGHGTHVAGSLAGDSLITPMGYDIYDGLAFGAKIAFYDIVDANGSWEPPAVRDILGDAYAYGAHTHSDSWGDDRREYTLRAQRVDQFQWDHSDFLSLWAAGNVGSANGTILEPATAKNAVAVGAAVNGNTTDLASFSSHGPTKEGLIAPLVVAPGVSIHSAKSDGQRNTFNDGYRDISGTSMATPFAAASSIIIEQYFREGFYPNGSRYSGPGFQPSGPLRKAILAASGWDQSGGDYVGGPVPDFGQGWGKIDLANALYLSGYAPSNRLWVSDYYNDTHVNDGLATGETRVQMITVNSSRPLKVILAWNDWPGAGLVNDLNLEVTCPNGTVYRGNQLVDGRSVESSTADATNTVEGVIVPNPPPGLYVVGVTAVNVGGGERQRYALAATGDLFDSSVALVRLDRHRTSPSSSIQVTLLDSDLRGLGQVSVDAVSPTEPRPEQLTLRESGGNGFFEGTLTVSPVTPARDGILSVKDRDEVRVYYQDPDPPGLSWDSCIIDGSPPEIAGAVVENLTNSSAFLTFETNEPSTVRVLYWNRYGQWEAQDFVEAYRHWLELRYLSPRTDYSLDIEVTDPYGNVRRADFGGKHISFRTHDLTFRPAPGYAGWAAYGEAGNRFSTEGLSAGMADGTPRLSGVAFDTSGYPRDSAVISAELRLMVKAADGAAGESRWTVELLDRSSAGIFDGSRARPNYTLLKDAGFDYVLGDQFGPAGLAAGRWQIFTFTSSEAKALQRNLADGHAVFRIKGPLSGPDSLLEWYSGQSEDTAVWAPQLVLDLDYPPRVLPWAADRYEMDEDTVDTGNVNCSRIFGDEEPLAFDTPSHQEGSGANVTVQIASDGAVTFMPRENWNGVELVQLGATDPYGLSAVHTLILTVRAVNDPPRIIAVNGTAARDGMTFIARQDETLTVPVEVQDPDLDFEGERLWYVTNDTLVRFLSASSPVLSFNPTNDDIGTRNVRVSVRDPDYDDSVNLTFIIENVNDPPTAYLELPQPGAGYDNLTPVRFSANGSSDPDIPWGDELNYRWESNLTGIVGYGEELSVILPPGRHTITLVVWDLAGATDFSTVELSVQGIEPPPPPPVHITNPVTPVPMREMLLRAMAVSIIILALVAAWFLVSPRRRRGTAVPDQRVVPGGSEYEPDENLPDAGAEAALEVEALEEE